MAYAQANKIEIVNLSQEVPVPENITFFTGYRRRIEDTTPPVEQNEFITK